MCVRYMKLWKTYIGIQLQFGGCNIVNTLFISFYVNYAFISVGSISGSQVARWLGGRGSHC